MKERNEKDLLKSRQEMICQLRKEKEVLEEENKALRSTNADLAEAVEHLRAENKALHCESSSENMLACAAMNYEKLYNEMCEAEEVGRLKYARLHQECKAMEHELIRLNMFKNTVELMLGRELAE